jgi:hypothetical protein
MRLDVSGNLGIGTTTPEARLHIHSPDNNALKVTNTAVGKSLRIGVDQLGAWLEPTEQNSSIRLNANPDLTGLLIDGQTGNVGIGTTQPGRLLTLEGGPELALRLQDNRFSAFWELQASAFLTDHFGIVRYDGGVAQASKSLIITPDGTVGIGTTTPQSKLDVQTDQPLVTAVRGHSELGTGIEGTSDAADGVIGRSTNLSGVSAISVNGPGVAASSATGSAISAVSTQFTEEPQVSIEANNTLPGAFARLRMRTNTPDINRAWDIAVGGTTNVMEFVFNGLGQFGIYSVLSLSSDGNATLRGVLRQNSSRALKDQIHDLAYEEAIDALQSLTPVQFTLKSDSEAKRHLGFISEELPDLLAAPDRMTVSSMDIIAVLTKVVQAQQQTLTALTHKINGLERGLA